MNQVVNASAHHNGRNMVLLYALAFTDGEYAAGDRKSRFNLVICADVQVSAILGDVSSTK